VPKILVAQIWVSMALICAVCRQLQHIDATGARTLGTLNSSLASKGIHLTFAGLGSHSRSHQVREY
jgi:hypothetical protein